MKSLKPLDSVEDQADYDRRNFLTFPYGAARFREINEIGFARLNKEIVGWLSNYLRDKNVTEVGAGLGYVSAHLAAGGVRMTAYDVRSEDYSHLNWYKDPENYFFDVQHADVTEFESFKDDIILMSWPCRETNFAEKVARLLKPGQVLIHLGEGRGGCTASVGFYDFVESDVWTVNEVWTHFLNSKYKSWSGVGDYWTVYIRGEDQ